MSIKIFFDDLATHNISYYCWKGVSKIEDFFDGDADVDLYVTPKHADLFRDILRNHQFVACHWPIELQGVEHYYKVSDGGGLHHVHVYFRMRTGSSLAKEYELLPHDCLAESTVRFSGVSTLASHHLCSLHHLRIKLKKSSLIGRLIYLRKKLSHDLEAEALAELGCEISNDLDLKVEKIVRSPTILGVRMFLSIKLRRLRGLSKKVTRGVVVSVIGPDGAGKSTITERLLRDYGRSITISRLSFGRPSIQLATSPFYLVRNLLIFLRGFRASTHEKVDREFGRSPSLLRALFFVMLAYERRAVMAKARRLKNRGRIVVLDRSPAAEPGRFDGYHLRGFSAGSLLFEKLRAIEAQIYDDCSAVDIVFRLNVSADQVLERNRARTKAFKESDYQIEVRYRHFLEFRPKALSTVELDGSASPQENAAAVMGSVFKALA